MFYFFLNIMFYFLLIIGVYYYLSRNRITILDFLLLLFLLNIYFILILNKVNIIIGLLVTLTIILIKNLYQFLYVINKKQIEKERVLVNRGQINFHALIDNQYSYNKLINNLQRKGIKDVSEIDYCALYNNELIIFRNNVSNYPINLIIDGKIIKDNLKCIKKDYGWLMDMLVESNLTEKQVSYAFYKDEKLYLLTNM